MSYPSRNGHFSALERPSSDEPIDSAIELQDMVDAIGEHQGTVALEQIVDRVVYVALLLGKSVDEVAGRFGISASEVYALNRRAKEQLIGSAGSDGELVRALVAKVRGMAKGRGRYGVKKAPVNKRETLEPRNAFSKLVLDTIREKNLSREEAKRQASIADSTLWRAERGLILGRVALPKVCAWLGISEDEGIKLMGTPAGGAE